MSKRLREELSPVRWPLIGRLSRGFWWGFLAGFSITVIAIVITSNGWK